MPLGYQSVASITWLAASTPTMPVALMSNTRPSMNIGSISPAAKPVRALPSLAPHGQRNEIDIAPEVLTGS